MKLFLLLILSLWLGLYTNKAQADTSYFIEDSLTEILSVDPIGDKLIVFASDNNWTHPDAWVTDINNGAVSKVTLDAYNYQSPKPNNSGVFFTSYEGYNGVDKNYYLNYVDTLANASKLIIISEHTTSNVNTFLPTSANICGDRYYIIGYISQQYCVWESDGSLAGTQIIFQSNDPISSLNSKDDNLLIAVNTGTNCDLYHYQYGQVPSHFYSIANASVGSKIGQDDDFIYFNSAGGIWRTNFQTSGTSLYTPHYSPRIDFNKGKFHLYKNGIYNQNDSVFVGDTVSPQLIRPFVLKNKLQLTSYNITFLANNYMLYNSIETGKEIAILTEHDSIELTADLAEGVNSSIALKFSSYNGYSAGDYKAFTVFKDSILYAVQSNGNDSLFYVYRYGHNTSESLFSIAKADKIINLFYRNNVLYWLSFEDGNLSISHRNLNQPNVIQPSPSISDTWFRQFGVSHNMVDVMVNQLKIYPQEIFLTPDNEVVFSGVSNAYVGDSKVYSSNFTETYDLKGAMAVGKYDANGSLLWVNGVGINHGVWQSRSSIAMRSNGNVVVFGTYYINAYFDQDSLSNPSAGTFLAELDGMTGKVLWKRDIATSSTFLNTDAMVIDKSDNIYISFLYTSYSISFDGIVLTSIKNGVNGLAKFDPMGQIKWAKNTETPWLDSYGKTYTFEYDSINDILTSVQSQDFYNGSSSCQYDHSQIFIQTHSTDGTLLDTFSIVGDDLGSITVGTYTSDNNFLGMGYFRSQLVADNFTLQTDPLGSCYRKEGFGIVYQQVEQSILNAFHTKGQTFFPVDLDKTADAIYVLGTLNEDLTICKFNLAGEFIALKSLGQTRNVFNWGERLYLDVNQDYIAVLGIDFSRNSSQNVSPLITEKSTMSIWKMKNDGFILANIWFSKEPNWNLETDISIFPNPSNGLINIASQDVFESYVLCDVNGKVISSDILQKQDVYYTQEVDLRGIAKGAYIIYLTNADKQLAAKVIIE